MSKDQDDDLDIVGHTEDVLNPINMEEAVTLQPYPRYDPEKQFLEDFVLTGPSSVKADRALKKHDKMGWTAEEVEKLRNLATRYQEKNWKKIAEYFPGRTHHQCLQHWRTVANPRIGVGKWTPKEDAKLLNLVEKYGKKWSLISEHLPRREGKRCRERYMNILHPDRTKTDWSEEEERTLEAARAELGTRWSEIARLLPGRSVNDVKNHYCVLMRKQLQQQQPQPPVERSPNAKKRGRVGGTNAKWTKAEQDTLKSLVEQFGPKKWLFIASHLPDRTDLQCMQHWHHVMNPKVVKGKGSWTEEEDKLLIERVGVLGKKWSKIAEYLPHRIGKQCRERYLNHLDPELNKGPWTTQEDGRLLREHARNPNKWAEIARHLPGRCDIDVKNRMYCLMQRRNGEKNAEGDNECLASYDALPENDETSDDVVTV